MRNMYVESTEIASWWWTC